MDLQLELSKQETTRMKTQIEYLSQSLEETRKTLSEVRNLFFGGVRMTDTVHRSVNVQSRQLLQMLNTLN